MKSINRLQTYVQDLTQRFQSCERGAIAIIVALAVIPMMVAGGLAVDLSRAYLTKSRLGHALDAAGLAVGSMRTTSTDSSYLETQFNSFFAANYPSTEVGTTHDITFVDNGGIITVTGKATVDTVFMGIVGIDTITVSSSSEIEVETNGLELVMVLDNTGSMGSTKLSQMKTAALDMIDILFGDETSPELLKVGLVPFSGSVNIGTGMSAFVNDTSVYDWGSTSWDGCVMARAHPADIEDTTVSSGGYWDPFYWADNNSYNNWDYGGGSYSIDTSPPSSKGPNKYCPREVTPLTNDRTTLEDEINAQWSSGYTHINYGAIWGWRMISPEAPFTEGSSYGDEDWNKAVIILTDGDNTTSSSVHTAYEYRGDGVLGSTSSSGTTSELNTRTTEVCDGMKDAGIIVYTITFQVTSSSTQDLFEDCASSTDKYYNSPDSATLTLAFRAIGAELKNLHLSQ